jgi:hypothetical protein
MRIQFNRSRLALGAGFLGMLSLVVLWGHNGSLPRATANPPQQNKKQVAATPSATAAASDYSQRVVAYIYGTIPITREELGEYLIARMGVERLNNLVNRRIIEHVCAQKGIEVTAAEVEADFNEMLKGLGPSVDAKHFEKTVLKPHGKTLYEWKEDVIKPRLLLTRLCQGRIQVTQEDLQKGFEAYYGDKVECRLIIWPKHEKNIAMNMWAKVRDSEEEFDRAARTQASPTLAAQGGKVPPVGHNTTGNPELEKAIFSLQPGELSPLIDTPDGCVVVKCLKRLPPNTDVSLDDPKLREKLTKEIIDKKTQIEIPKVFNELRLQADPVFILKNGTSEEEMLRDVQQELHSDASKNGPPATH